MKTIMISDEAYQKLASRKGKKSFTELLIELSDNAKQTSTGDLLQFAGIMPSEEAEAVERVIKKVRKNARMRA